MTLNVGGIGRLQRMLEGCGALFLDFDGPICSIFAGIPAHVIARELCEVLADDKSVALTKSVQTQDPIEVLRHAVSLGKDGACRVEAFLTAREIDAVPSAKPTPYSREVISGWHAVGRQIVIVSNNSTAAIQAYLKFHSLNVPLISARTSSDISKLKPNPDLVSQAITLANQPPEQCTLIGDSVTDISAAQAAGIKSIGYANKPGKRATLLAAGADLVVDSMSSILVAIDSLDG